MTSNLSEELIQALDEEIDAIKRGRAGNVVKIFNGRFQCEISGVNVYLFNTENFLATLEDSPAEIEIAGHRYAAQVLLTQGLEVEIGLEYSLGEFISEATLYTNAWYLLEILKRKLAELHSEENKADSAAATLFVGSSLEPSAPIGAEISYSLGDSH